jgi:hypothetical protein
MIFMRSTSTFADRLQNALADADAQAIILRNSRMDQGSRLFNGLPLSFDAVFDRDAKVDFEVLKSILFKIENKHKKNKNHPAYEMTEDNGYQFTNIYDNKKIERWSKAIIARACEECLTDDNEIKPDVMLSLGLNRGTLSPRGMVSAYVAFISQYIMLNLLPTSPDSNRISRYLSLTVQNCLNQYPAWIDQTLQKRAEIAAGIFDFEREEKALRAELRAEAQSEEDSTFTLKFAAAATLGFFLAGPVGAAIGGYAVMQSHAGDSNSDTAAQDDNDIELGNEYRSSLSGSWHKL